MATRSKFQFGANQYEIENCSLSASLPDPYWCDKYNKGKDKDLRWCLSIEAEELEAGEEVLAPSVEIDALPIRIPNWHELAGATARWTTAINPKTDDRYGITYVHDHILINRCMVAIRDRRGSKFHVVASGVDDEGQTFEFEGSMPFTGVYVSASDRDTAKTTEDRLALSLDTSNLSASRFVIENHGYNSGVKVASMQFTPKAR